MTPQHLVVRASAGTGKTYRLATRYLTLLRLGAPPAAILATTFTRKAAGEILGRVLVRLAKAAGDAREAAKLARDVGDLSLDAQACGAMLAELCAGLHRVSVSTLDSFFGRVAQSFRYELEIPLAATMAGPDDPRIVQIRRRAIEATLAGEEIPVLLDLLRRLHHDSVRSTVTRAVDEIVTGLYEFYRHAPRGECWTRVNVPVGPDKAQVDGAIAALGAEVEGFSGNGNVRKGLAKALGLARAGDWEAFITTGVGAALGSGGTLYYNKPLPAPIAAAMAPLVAHARTHVIAQYARMNEATWRLIHRFDEHFTPLRQAQGLLLFSDLPHRLAQRMGGESDADSDEALAEMYYRLDAQVGHLLLDEFQDTSPEQWRVLLPLAREICAHVDGSRSLFCVGDTKQAIYGWRGGSAELFAGVRAELLLPPSAAQSMSLSYRSAQPVLDAVNEVFGGGAPAAILSEYSADVAGWQEGYEAHKTAKPELAGYVELVTSVPGTAPETDEEADADDAGEGRVSSTPHEDFAADRVAQIVAAAPGKSVGVLVGRNVMVRLMIDLLRKRGVPASGEGGTPVTDDPAVNVVLSAMTMADHPGDETAAFHVFHSPLAPILGLKSRETTHVQDVALGVRRDLTNRGYAQVITHWARELAPSCDERSALRLGQLVELADRYDPELTLRPRQFAQFVRATPIEEPSPAAVRVMTVHKAKGLEFDVVVLPELDRRIVEIGQGKVYLDRPAPTAPIYGVYRAVKRELRDLMPDVADAYAQEMGRRLRDDLSALYVAMTRPRHALHMIVRPLTSTKKGAPGTQGLTNYSFASILRRALAADRVEGFEGGETLYQHGDPQWHAVAAKVPASTVRQGVAPVAEPIQLPAAWRTPGGRSARSWAQVSPSSLERQGRVKVEDLLAVSPSAGRARGSLFHAWFEELEYLGKRESVPGDDVLLATAVRSGVAESEAAKELAEFRRMLAQPAVVKALAQPMARGTTTFELWRERPFAVRVGERLLAGTFDRVVVEDSAGHAVAAELLDYKTDRLAAGDASALADAVEHYRPQVEAYCDALREMLGLEKAAVKATLLFVAIGLAVRVV